MWRKSVCGRKNQLDLDPATLSYQGSSLRALQVRDTQALTNVRVFGVCKHSSSLHRLGRRYAWFSSHPSPFPLQRSTQREHNVLAPLEKLAIRVQYSIPVSGEGTTPESEEIEGGQRLTEGPIGRRRTLIVTQKAELSMLRRLKEKCARNYTAAKERITKLEHQLGESSKSYQGAVVKRDRRIQTLEDELTRTKELFAARTTPEHSNAQPFSPTPDRLSDIEVLGVIRDLNENIFQVAVILTEEWEELRSSRPNRSTTTKENVDSFSQSYGPALIHQVLNRKPAAVTFLVQSCLCELATQITSSWRQNEELRTLRSVYQRLSPSGENTSHLTSET